MTAWQGILTIAVVALGTLCTRFLPFLVFPESKQPPSSSNTSARCSPMP